MSLSFYRDISVFPMKKKKKNSKIHGKHTVSMEWNESVLWISSLWLQNCTLNGVAFVCGSKMLLYCKKWIRRRLEHLRFCVQIFLGRWLYCLTQNQHYSRNCFRKHFPVKNDYRQFWTEEPIDSLLHAACALDCWSSTLTLFFISLLD